MLDELDRELERRGHRFARYEVLEQLKAREAHADRSSAAERLIEVLADLYLEEFKTKVERFQDMNDPAEVERLRGEISRELFGS